MEQLSHTRYESEKSNRALPIVKQKPKTKPCMSPENPQLGRKKDFTLFFV